jgi:hypothetical protein
MKLNPFNRRNKLMADIADNVLATLTAVQALATQVSALTIAIAALQPTTPVDISGLATSAEVNALSAQLTTVLADLSPTPVAPSPAPATASSGSGTGTSAA